jgi:hypothetical protein
MLIDVARGTPLFDDPDGLFRTRFDQREFAFMHRLADDPLFEPGRLLAIARQMAQDPNDVYYDAGSIGIGQRWDQTPVCDQTVEELLERIETADAWILLRKVDKHPAYAALLDACIAEIEERVGRDLGNVMKVRNALIFINSPHRISTYHIDRECSLLLQIRGTKTVSVFNRNDRDVLPEQEIERFWTVDNNAAVYKPDLEHRAVQFTLTPGCAIHIPVNAPHWVKNGPAVSVSLNINFHYKDVLLADVYRANHWLRRMGLHPTPPRRSPLVDGVKGRVYSSGRDIARAARRMLGKTK